MSDTAQPTLGNEPTARTETGEIKSQTPSQTAPTPPETPTPAEAKPETQPVKTETEPSLLNKEDPQAAGAPDKYDFRLPEGMELTEDGTKEVDTLFRSLGLNNASGQKLVDFYVQKLNEATEAPYKMWNDYQRQWVDEIKADPEIGKRLPEVRATVARAIDGLGDAKLANEFRQAMDVTGAGNHPAFVRAFWKLAQQVTEGGHVAGRGPSPEGQKAPGEAPRSAAAALYPNLK
jgi:hypothetical protein